MTEARQKKVNMFETRQTDRKEEAVLKPNQNENI
jgi:hypothetical protein